MFKYSCISILFYDVPTKYIRMHLFAQQGLTRPQSLAACLVFSGSRASEKTTPSTRFSPENIRRAKLMFTYYIPTRCEHTSGWCDDETHIVLWVYPYPVASAVHLPKESASSLARDMFDMSSLFTTKRSIFVQVTCFLCCCVWVWLRLCTIFAILLGVYMAVVASSWDVCVSYLMGYVSCMGNPAFSAVNKDDTR